MEATRHIFVGRDGALSELEQALARAQAGLGGMLLVRGEAGIGKTRLVEELAARAQASGVAVFWGRAWEAGGAPAYWPFTEVLRGLLRRPGALELLSPARQRVLAQIAPEMRDEEVPAPAALPPEQARFVLLDALVSTLCDATADAPLLLLLDDMHAADVESLLALELLAVQARSSKLLVVATARPTALADGAGSLLTRAERVARTLSLARLSRPEVEAFLAQTLGRTPDEKSVDALFATCEGNPLFLVELTRLLAQRGTLDRPLSLSPRAIPHGVRTVIGQRLSAMQSESRAVLEVACVLGREFAEDLLARVCQCSADTREAAVWEAVDAQVLELAAPGSLRFTHVLVRDVLHAGLSEAARHALHLRAADALARASTLSAPPWPSIAHHLLHAGPQERERAIEAARCAAEQASAQLAFEEARSWLERALEAERERKEGSPRAAELTLMLARAHAMSGDLKGGRALCVQAAEMARRHDDAQLLARAALEYGRAFVFASIDRTLVDLLEEALAKLPPGEKSLRARLSARRAAALQPAPDPQVPIADARRALALARSLADRTVLLETLRSVTSAMADLGDPAERALLNEEYARLARELAEPFEALRGYCRLTFDHYELGDAAAAHRALAEVEGLAARLDVPHVRWMALGLFAMRALHEGRFAESEALWEQARVLAARAHDPNAERCLGMQQLARLRIQGRAKEALASVPRLRVAYAELPYARAWLDLIEEAARSQATDVRTPLREELVQMMVDLRDPSMLTMASEHAYRTRDAALAARIEPCFEDKLGCVATWGASGLCVDTPVSRCLALCAAARGAHDLAIERFEQALALVEATGARPHQAWILQELSQVLRERAQPGDDERAQGLEQRAGQLAEALGIVWDHGAPHRPSRPSTPPPAVVPPSLAPARDEGITLEPQGELWLLTGAGKSVHLEDTKGLRYLAQLLAAPRQSFHVLELSGVDPSQADRGSAGQVLDKLAVQRYKARIRELREELDELEGAAPSPRSEALREELEALEEQLLQGLGLGARARQASGNQVERARINVQRRIRDALGRIEAHAPELSRRLERALKTGVFCVYDP